MSATGHLTLAGQKSVMLLSILIDVMGFGVVIPILPYFAESFVAGTVLVGTAFLVSLYAGSSQNRPANSPPPHAHDPQLAPIFP
jgi:hypothetical protein